MGFVVVGVLLLLLRSLELWPVADLNWWWVIGCFCCAIAWWVIKDATGWTQRDQMAKVDAKKAARRRRALEALGQYRKSR
jgi:small Trp-rich protein